MIECSVGIIRRKTKVICQHMLVTNIHTGDLLIIADVIDDTLLFINSFETATKSDVQPAIISLVDKDGKEYNNLCFSLIHAIVKSQGKKIKVYIKPSNHIVTDFVVIPIVEETQSKAILRLIKTDEPYNIGDLIAHKTRNIYKIAGENHINNTDWLKVMILLTTEPTVHTLGTFSTISDNKQVNSSIIGYGSYIAASIYKGILKGELRDGDVIPVSYRLV